jgi:tight adherence protein B
VSGLVGVLVALAVLAASGSGGRPVGARAPERPGDGAAGARSARSAPDLSGVLLGVCAQLRAGATPAEAWSRVTGASTVGSVPTIDALLTATSRPAHLRIGGRGHRRENREVLGCVGSGGRRRLGRRSDDGAVVRVRAAVAAARLSDELGAPLAGVLERIASAVAADEEADGERRSALAGPRSTAQVLAWLPLLGVALGTLLGADPLAVVLSGGLGTVSAVLGVVMLVLGRWWTAALLARAGRAGEGRSRVRGAIAVRADAARTRA